MAGITTLEDAMRVGLSIDDCVARLKRHHWSFRRLHEIFIKWLTAEPVYELNMAFPLHAHYCAEHADAWRKNVGEMRPAAAADDSQTWVYQNFVYGTTSAAMIAPTQSGARYEGTQIAAASVRGGVTSIPRGAPSNSVDLSGSGVGTLVLDLVDGIVVRIRLEP